MSNTEQTLIEKLQNQLQKFRDIGINPGAYSLMIKQLNQLNQPTMNQKEREDILYELCVGLEEQHGDITTVIRKGRVNIEPIKAMPAQIIKALESLEELVMFYRKPVVEQPKYSSNPHGWYVSSNPLSVTDINSVRSTSRFISPTRS